MTFFRNEVEKSTSFFYAIIYVKGEIRLIRAVEALSFCVGGNMFNPQFNIDRINNQIMELEKMKSQLGNMQVPIINQTFQQTSPSVLKYAESLDDVNKEMVVGDTPYFSKDMSVLWVKNIKGEVKTYELKEVVLKDEKDLLIESLQLQIKEMKENAKSTSSNDVESIKDEESKCISNDKQSNRKQR